MGPAPAVVLVVRHGLRLDAADKSWHLTSPTPYDPPLTYGGWTQSRALGLRIAAILDKRAQEQSESSSITSDPTSKPRLSRKKKKKQKILIHTSPFLRCVQTSIGISAGMAAHVSSSTESSNTLGENRIGQATNGAEAEKPKLRIDGFLGEWLSPDYFDHITPPPNSTMMVACAKADLLRKAEYVEVRQAANLNMGNFPGGWGSSNGQAKSSANERDPLARLGSLAQVLTLRDRSTSQGSADYLNMRPTSAGYFSTISNGYVAPQPAYAVAQVDPIPRGYVAHARDACVDIDFAWDSMREPVNWPDGGEFGDEWSIMHKRFRKGINSLVGWYQGHGTEPQSLDCAVDSDSNSSDAESDDDDDVELVVILVTHAAGCNALIGALTNQPVLLDCPMASLTMAVRKEANAPSAVRTRSASAVSNNSQRSYLTDADVLSEIYEMRLVASGEHLRPGFDPYKLDHVPSPKIVPRASRGTRSQRSSFGQFASETPIDGSFNLGEPRQSAMSAALNGVRRSDSRSPSRRSHGPPLNTTVQSTGATPSSGISSTGLWSSPVSAKPTSSLATVATVNASAKENVTSRVVSQPQAKRIEIPADEEHHDAVQPLRPALSRHSSASKQRLWGASSIANQKPPNKSLWTIEAMDPRVHGPKRRWTVTESDAVHAE